MVEGRKKRLIQTQKIALSQGSHIDRELSGRKILQGLGKVKNLLVMDGWKGELKWRQHGRVVRVLDLQSQGLGFKSCSDH